MDPRGGLSCEEGGGRRDGGGGAGLGGSLWNEDHQSVHPQVRQPE